MFTESPPSSDQLPPQPDGEAVELAPELAQAQTPVGETVGQVSAVEGVVFVTHADGAKVQASDGTPVLQGDVVETQAGGALGITFADDSTFSLAENGSMTIDEMVYDPGSQSGKSALSVAEGVFTFVSGQIAKTGVDAMTITTPVAVIGIRGTSGGGRAGPEGTPNTFSMFVDPGTPGSFGEMVIRTLGGTQNLSSPLQTTQISSQYVPPLKPVTLPAAVAQQFYAKAAIVAPKAIVTQPTAAGPAAAAAAAAATGDTNAQAGPAAAGPTNAPAGDQPAAGPGQDVPADQLAAVNVFEQQAAAGGLDAAIAAAVDAAGAQELNAVLASNPVAFGSVESGAAIMNRIVDDVVLGVTGRIDPMSAGTGGSTGLDHSVGNLFQNDITRNIRSAISDVANGIVDDLRFGGEGDFLGPGAGGTGALDAFFDPGFFDPFQNIFFEFFTPLNFDNGIVTFEGDPFFFDDDVNDDNVTNVFDDFADGTTGNDTLVGGEGNTRFTMIQGSTLGGTDVLFGGGGTDEIALENLNGLAVVFNASTNVINYANLTTSTISGSITLNSVEQVFADDGAESRVRLPFDIGDSGFGYIIAGTTGNDTALSAATGIDLTSAYSGLGGSGTTTSSATTFGSIIFGNAGDDTITGSASGDLLFGGSGNDTITTGGNGDDDEAVFGGAGNDTIIAVSSSDVVDSSNDPSIAVDGGAGTDTLQLGSASSGQTFTLASGSLAAADLQGIEILALPEASTTVSGSGSFFFDILTSITAAGGSSTIAASDGVLKLTDVNVAAGITTITAVNGTPAVTVFDSAQDAIGRNIIGGTGGDNLEGFGGGDTFKLNGGSGADSASDVVFYRNQSDTAASAGTNTGFDQIIDFETSTDQIIFRLSNDFANFDDVGTQDNVQLTAAATTGNANLQAAEVIYITNAVTDGDLTTTGFANVISAIGAVTAGTATAADAENDAIFIINGSTDSGIYLYQNQDAAGAGNTTVDADELTLLTTVDAVLTQSDNDVSFTAT